MHCVKLFWWKPISNQLGIPGDIQPVVFRARVAAHNAPHLVAYHLQRLPHRGAQVIPLALAVDDILQHLRHVRLFDEITVSGRPLLQNGIDFISLIAFTSLSMSQFGLILSLFTHIRSSFS